MGWRVLFWNIQGTARGNIKLNVVKEVVALVNPDIICFAEVGLNFPYDEFPGYIFEDHIIQDKNNADTPKGLALGVWSLTHTIQGKLTPAQSTLTTSKAPVQLTRPILVANVSGVEILIVHAPSSGGALGRVTMANVADYFRDQCRGSRGKYQGFAIGDFNAHFSPFMIPIEDAYVEVLPARRVKRTSTYYYAIQSRDPMWDITQKSGGVIDFMITCGVVARAETSFHNKIEALNSSKYLGTWLSRPKTSVLADSKASPAAAGGGAAAAGAGGGAAAAAVGGGKLILQPPVSADSVYADVKAALDKGFKVVAGAASEIAGWHIDHRPVIYELITAGGSGAPRIVESSL